MAQVESQSPKAGHGYSDFWYATNSHGIRTESQSPKAGHGYSNGYIAQETEYDNGLNPLKRVMGILIRLPASQ